MKEIRTLALKAEGWNGYDTWAKFGYDAPISKRIHNLLIKDDAEKYKNVKTIQDLMKMPGGKDFWKKHGESFKGVFDLRPGSKSMEAFEAYKKEKKMKNNRKDSQENLKRNEWSFDDIPIELRIKEDELENDFRREDENLEKLKEIYSANPSDELSKEIERAEKRMWKKYLKFANFSTKIHGF